MPPMQQFRTRQSQKPPRRRARQIHRALSAWNKSRRIQVRAPGYISANPPRISGRTRPFSGKQSRARFRKRRLRWGRETLSENYCKRLKFLSRQACPFPLCRRVFCLRTLCPWCGYPESLFQPRFQ